MKKFFKIFIYALMLYTGLLLLAVNYGYLEGYHVQAWWPIIFVIMGAFKLVKHLFFDNCIQSNETTSKSY